MQALCNAFLQLVGLHPDAPGSGALLVTPDDGNDLPRLARALYVDNPGTVKFTAADGSIDAWATPGGTALPIAVRRVWSTGTTAGIGVHAIY